MRVGTSDIGRLLIRAHNTIPLNRTELLELLSSSALDSHCFKVIVRTLGDDFAPAH